MYLIFYMMCFYSIVKRVTICLVKPLSIFIKTIIKQPFFSYRRFVFECRQFLQPFGDSRVLLVHHSAVARCLCLAMLDCGLDCVRLADFWFVFVVVLTLAAIVPTELYVFEFVGVDFLAKNFGKHWRVLCNFLGGTFA